MSFKDTVQELTERKARILREIEGIDKVLEGLQMLNGGQPKTMKRKGGHRRVKRHVATGWVREVNPNFLRLKKASGWTYADFAIALIRKVREPVTMEELFQSYQKWIGKRLPRTKYAAMYGSLNREAALKRGLILSAKMETSPTGAKRRIARFSLTPEAMKQNPDQDHNGSPVV